MSTEINLDELDAYGEPIDQHPERRKRFETLYDRTFGGARTGVSAAAFEGLDSCYRAMDANQRTGSMMGVAERQLADLLFLYNVRIDLLLQAMLANVEHCLGAGMDGPTPEQEMLSVYMAEQQRLQDRIQTLQERQLKIAEKKLRAEALWNRSGTAKARKPKPAPAE